MAFSSQLAPPAEVPAAAAPNSEGIAIGAGPVTLDAYVDFLCPYCRLFEQRAGGELDRLVAAEAITLVYHPLGFLDRLSSTRYSTRASAASGCAADGGHFREYSLALFANQPSEGGPGLSDGQLIQLGIDLGLGEDFERCVAAGRYVEWSEFVSTAAAARGVQGTPTVLVDGAQVPPDPRAIAAAVTQAASA